MDRKNGLDVRPNLPVENQPNGIPVVRAVIDADVRFALAAGIDYTIDPITTALAKNGTYLAAPPTDSEVAAAVFSGLNYSLPGPKKTR